MTSCYQQVPESLSFENNNQTKWDLDGILMGCLDGIYFIGYFDPIDPVRVLSHSWAICCAGWHNNILAKRKHCSGRAWEGLHNTALHTNCNLLFRIKRNLYRIFWSCNWLHRITKIHDFPRWRNAISAKTDLCFRRAKALEGQLLLFSKLNQMVTWIL